MPTRADHHLVKHREGWCIAAEGPFSDSDDNVATLCGQVVILPFGHRTGRPDCPDCARAAGR